MNLIPAADYVRILPELVFAAFGTLIMVLDPLLPEHASRRSLGLLAALGALLGTAATALQFGYEGTAFFGMVRVDAFSIFFHFVVGAVTLLAVLASLEYLETQELRLGEYYALMLFGATGMALMSSAVELVLIFIALEISSISTYVLAGIRRRVATSAESSVKYFLLGSFATAFFLYGVALMYGATASTNVAAIAAALRGGTGGSLVFIAVALMFVGIGFKVAAAPFHIWTPDVYEGAPAPVVALMSTGPKAAAFAVLLRILFGAASPGWYWLVWVAAVLSMTLGNLGALVQTNVKRMLAYSSIAHAGYLLVAFTASNLGIQAAIFYAAAYALMNVGAFAIVGHFASRGERYVQIDDYAGLGRRAPLLAVAFTVLLLSLIGIPITGGFFAKFYVFSAIYEAGWWWLVVVGVLATAVSVYYYLGIVRAMYMRPSQVTGSVVVAGGSPPREPGIDAAVLAAVVVTVGSFFVVQPLVDFANDAAAALPF